MGHTQKSIERITASREATQMKSHQNTTLRREARTSVLFIKKLKHTQLLHKKDKEMYTAILKCFGHMNMHKEITEYGGCVRRAHA